MSPYKLTKYCACHAKWPLNVWQKCAENRWNVISNAGTIRAWSEHDPRMIRPWSDHENANRNPPRKWGYFSRSPRFEPNLTFKHSPSAAPATKSNTWPSRNTAPTTTSNTWPSPSAAPATKSTTWPSPKTAPTMKSNTHSSSSWHMKPHLQCAEQSMSPYKLTKYCACHAKWPLNVWQKCAENRWNVISNAGTIRAWSEHDPRMIRAWKRKPQPASQVRLLFEVPRSIFYCKIQRFEPNLTFKHSPSAAPATKSNTWPSRNTAPTTTSNTWPSPSAAPATKSTTWPSPNTAPTTKSNTHSSSSWHMKPHLQCAEQSMSPYKLTKYCACHAKWPLNVWQKCAENRWNVISNAGTIRAWSEHDPRMIRPWSDHENANRNPPRKWGYFSRSPRFEPNLTFKHSPSAAPATKSNTWHWPNTAPTTKVTLELPQILPLPRKVTLDLHQVLHLPRKVTFELTLLYLTLLYLTLLYLTLLYLTLLYLTLLYLTRLYLTLLYLTLIYWTLLYLILLYLTRL